MAHKGTNAMAVVSAVMFIGVLAMWLSYWSRRPIAFHTADASHTRRAFYVGPNRGGIAFGRFDPVAPPHRIVAWFDDAATLRLMRSVPPSKSLQALGCYIQWNNLVFVGTPKGRSGGVSELVGRGTHVVIPTWFLLAVTDAIPVARLYGWRRRLRTTTGRCGYDLRATPDRCPECGRSPSAMNPT